ncbi:MAG: MogA/MoaB family molybdenum cofactor biosynthesis protein [Synergistaceae bacterium]|jgi:molybdenum cofactor synthesis domain-containing protein|nr:MogA/MoaB family molybdenum cofactor biosynthesis protein [Synergistaceae bacterium]
MSDRILGLYNADSKEWDKLVYLHNNSKGSVCVNGAPAVLVLNRPGDAVASDAGYVIVVPQDFEAPNERYITIGDGDCMLWLDSDGVLGVCNSGFAGVSSRLTISRRISACVLTVSDKASRGERVDTAGPMLADMAEAIGAKVEERATVPDKRDLIAQKLTEWADKGFQLVLTTGGTGISRRDVTPEALMDVHDKIVPGFGEIMRNRSMAYTTRGFLTRSLAVTRGGALIIAFPGSERAVRQCFEAIAPSIRHAVEILVGWDVECGGHYRGEK